MNRLVFLGPQRFEPTVRETMRSLGVEGPVAAITAGWQERESEDQELSDHLGCRVVDLLLYHRADDVLLRDRELADALRQRQEDLGQLQEFYRLRLRHEIAAARELMRTEGRGRILEEQRRAAIRAVRRLDRQHLRALRKVHRAFDERWRPGERIAVARHREQLAAILDQSGALAIAGGHVAVLLNRMRLFDLAPLIGARPVVAWSAGAMALTDCVVLFHDNPPQGQGVPEVLEAGLGFCRDIVPLPHALRRLRLDDRVRVSLFARRFAPSSCVILERDTRLDWTGEWKVLSARVLDRGGRIRELREA